jgi:hypothetical protein
MFRLKRLVRGLSLLLSLVLVLAPVLPAFASVAKSGEAHAVHVSHGHDHRADGPSGADHHSTTCTQHDSSVGHDRDCCAHCFGLVPLVQAVYFPPHPVQTPVLKALHSFFLITSPDRPPRSFFL